LEKVADQMKLSNAPNGCNNRKKHSRRERLANKLASNNAYRDLLLLITLLRQIADISPSIIERKNAVANPEYCRISGCIITITSHAITLTAKAILRRRGQNDASFSRETADNCNAIATTAIWAAVVIIWLAIIPRSLRNPTAVSGTITDKRTLADCVQV
jgi:hypothetical protein